jgi:acetyl-CoA carboxylase alpha subunit
MEPLSLAELAHEEGLALVGLLKRVIEADKQLADAMGRHSFNQMVDEARARFPSLDALKAHVATIERPEARALIYRTAREMADVDGDRAFEEDALLGWLARLWAIEA